MSRKTFFEAAPYGSYMRVRFLRSHESPTEGSVLDPLLHSAYSCGFLDLLPKFAYRNDNTFLHSAK